MGERRHPARRGAQPAPQRGADVERRQEHTVVLARQRRDGHTFATLLVTHDVPEARDMHLESGMEAGLRDALDLLEQAAQSLR